MSLTRRGVRPIKRAPAMFSAFILVWTILLYFSSAAFALAPATAAPGIYRNSDYNESFRFFARNDAIYVEANITDSSGGNVTDATVVANFTVGGAVENSTTLTILCAQCSTYRGLWATNSTQTAGVYTVNITATNAEGSAYNLTYLHLYSGSGVSAYSMDFDGDGSSENIMENKHLVVAFNSSANSTGPIEYLYLKDTNTSYNFSNSQDAYSAYRGGIGTSDARLAYGSLNFAAEGENLASAAINSTAAYNDSYYLQWQGPNRGKRIYQGFNGGDADNDGRNELLEGGNFRNFSIFKWNGTAYALNYTIILPLSDIVSGYMVGDTDNDGLNELVLARDYNVSVYKWNGTDYRQNGTTKSYNYLFDVFIGDADNNATNGNEIVVSDDSRAKWKNPGQSELFFLRWNGTDYDQYSSLKLNPPDNDTATMSYVCDSDDDGDSEVLTSVLDLNEGVIVYVHQWNGSSYVQEKNMTAISIAYSSICKDSDLDGRPEIHAANDVAATSRQLRIYEDGTYSQKPSINFGAEPIAEGIDVGDVDNDGRNELVVSTNMTRVYQWDGASYALEYTINSSYTGVDILMTTIGDYDNDGYNEIYIGGYENVSRVYKYAGRQADIEITMNSDDVDYLQYRLSGFRGHFNNIFSDVSGKIGSSVEDDSYRLENGTDSSIISLPSNQWNNYTQSSSNYSLVYDNLTSSDSENNALLAFIRFNETQNISFKDVGLWNDTNGMSGARINYNISGFGANDSAYFLLTFTAGNPALIDSWMPTIKSGGYPDTGFMSLPNRTVNLTAYTSSFAQDSDASITIVNSTDESQTIASGTGSVAADLRFNRNYTVFVTKNLPAEDLTAKIIKLTITGDISLAMQTITSYSGPQPSSASVATAVFAFNDTGLTYENATLYIPNDGKTINKILHCTDWNFTSGSCVNQANWTTNATSDYGMQQNSTHFWFNTTSFDGFGGGSVYLEVSLATPPVSGLTDVVQNQTFTVNATTYCRGGDCGEVNGTVRYNSSSETPDTAISTTEGDTPFYIAESPAYSVKTCSSNPLIQDAFCNITWTINATGAQNSIWTLGTLFSSNDTSIAINHTDNATVKIVNCPVDMTVHFGSISFADSLWGTVRNATGNAGNQYNISINSGSCNTDVYVKTTDLTNATLEYTIGAGNITFGNATNNYADSFNLSNTYQPARLNVAPVSNITMYYWMSALSGIQAGVYSGTITIGGARNGEEI